MRTSRPTRSSGRAAATPRTLPLFGLAFFAELRVPVPLPEDARVLFLEEAAGFLVPVLFRAPELFVPDRFLAVVGLF